MWDPGMKRYCSTRHSVWWFYNICPYWEIFRLYILERHGYRCVVCGKADKIMNVDHRVAWAAGGDFWDGENLQVLCVPCHKKKNLEDVTKIKYSKRSKDTVLLDAFV